MCIHIYIYIYIERERERDHCWHVPAFLRGHSSSHKFLRIWARDPQPARASKNRMHINEDPIHHGICRIQVRHKTDSTER